MLPFPSGSRTCTMCESDCKNTCRVNYDYYY